MVMTANLNNSSNTTCINLRLPASDCIPWLVVLITECLAIVILNIITIIVFVKQRQLQRRSTYLIIHLAMVDLLVGAVSALLTIEEELGTYCDFWEFNFNTYYLKSPLRNLFPMTSLVNLAVISLERLHATFRPFRHRFVKKWVYGVIIAFMWVITTLKEAAKVVYYEQKGINYDQETLLKKIMTSSSMSICLLVICFSYIAIFIKVQCTTHPIHHGATSRERKLTGTLLFVTIASLLSWLPYTVFISMSYIYNKAILELATKSYFHVRMILLMSLGANSFTNPVVYALRIPEYSRGVRKIFCRDSNQINPANFSPGKIYHRQQP